MGFWRDFLQGKRELNYVSNFSDALTFSPMLNKHSAMNLSAVYRAVELISDSVAMLPIKVQRLDSTNGKSEVANHPLNLVFSTKDNDNLLSKYTLMKMLVQSIMLRGNGFAYIQRAQDGTVLGLRYLESSDVLINYNKQKDLLYYDIPVMGKKHVEPIDMIHLIKNSYDGVNGLSVISYAARTLGIAQATENSAKSFFDNGMNLSGVLTVEGQLQQKQKDDIRNSWAQAYTNGGQGLAVLQGNMKYQPIQINSKDAQLLESRIFNIEDIARFFGISPVLLGDLSHSSYNTIEAVQNDFLIHTLQPYVSLVENEFNRKLLKPSESKLTINLDTNEILRTDKSAQANYYKTMCDAGILSINEVRKDLGYSPIEGGDVHHIAFNAADNSAINADNKDNTPTNEQNI